MGVRGLMDCGWRLMERLAWGRLKQVLGEAWGNWGGRPGGTGEPGSSEAQPPMSPSLALNQMSSSRHPPGMSL